MFTGITGNIEDVVIYFKIDTKAKLLKMIVIYQKCNNIF